MLLDSAAPVEPDSGGAVGPGTTGPLQFVHSTSHFGGGEKRTRYTYITLASAEK